MEARELFLTTSPNAVLRDSPSSPSKAYRTILIDPPWDEQGSGRIKRGADRHYPLLKSGEIVSTIREAEVFHPDENSHLYLWVTNNHLQDGLLVLRAIGYRYVTNLVWVKDSIGLGQYFRGQHELLLFGVRGRAPLRTRSISTLIRAKKRKHSRKPDQAYAIAESVSYPPRLEMFARTRREGWDAWGLEVPTHIQRRLE